MAAAVNWLRRLLGDGHESQSSVIAYHLLPDPAVDWLRRAHSALGVFLADPHRDEDDPSVATWLGGVPERDSDVLAAQGRVRHAAEQDRGGVERLERGTLVVRAAHGFGAALLLPASARTQAIDQAAYDLDRLIEGLRRRPRITPFRPESVSEAHLETIEQVAIRLSVQLQHETGADSLVMALLPTGPTVVSVFGAVDNRLKNLVLEERAPIVQASRDERGEVQLADDPVHASAGDRRRRSRVAALVPIMVQEMHLGAVAIWFPGVPAPHGPLLEHAREIIRNAAPRFSRAIEHLRAVDASSRDALTGLPNRRRLESAMHRIGVSHGALIVADLDRFKVLNDTLGHPAGDSALRHFARIVLETVRGQDTPARIGGEEFAIWLPHTPLDDAQRIAERLRERLEGSVFTDPNGTPWALTASFGVASCPETSRHVDNLIAQADAALYMAKKEGRNRVVLAPGM